MEPTTNGQFRGLIGKLLVKGSDEKIAKIIKTKIQNAILELDNENDTIFDSFVGWINNDCKLQKVVSSFSSLLLLKTVSLKIGGQKGNFKPTESSVKNFLKKVFEREAELGNPTPSIDGDIWGWFSGKVMPGFQKFITTVYRFIKNLTHRQILEEAERTEVKKIYTYLEALSVIREAILSGEVDEKGKGIIAYFQVEGINKQYRFDAYRHDHGQLNLNVLEVAQVSEWRAGACACFSN